MIQLNFPDCKVNTVYKDYTDYIFDEIRRKWVILTPEEWVRIHCVNYLLNYKNVPKSMILVESQFKVYNTTKRLDVLVKRKDNSNFLLVECKAPSVTLNQQVLNQISRYNLVIKSQHLMITNGLNHLIYMIDESNKSYQIIENIPQY